VIERLWCVPDDRGARCAEVSDAISFWNAARERARQGRRPIAKDAAFHDLLRAFWSGAFEHRAPDGEVQSLVFTLEVPRGTSPDHPYSVTEDGHVLKRVVDEASGRVTEVATTERQAVFWTRREFYGLIRWFWERDDEGSASTRLADYAKDDEAFGFMAACSVEDYPTTARILIEKLHISRAALGSIPNAAFRIRASGKPRAGAGSGLPSKRGAREKSCWRWLDPLVLNWLDQEGEPDTPAEVERHMTRLLAERDEQAARSTLQRHARRLIAQHRQHRQADE
jgi:hypothetical protein